MISVRASSSLLVQASRRARIARSVQPKVRACGPSFSKDLVAVLTQPWPSHGWCIGPRCSTKQTYRARRRLSLAAAGTAALLSARCKMQSLVILTQHLFFGCFSTANTTRTAVGATATAILCGRCRRCAETVEWWWRRSVPAIEQLFGRCRIDRTGDAIVHFGRSTKGQHAHARQAGRAGETLGQTGKEVACIYSQYSETNNYGRTSLFMIAFEK